jgi:hypothetical protein
MLQTNAVVHFEILGKDQKLLEAFYKGVFDWEITSAMEGYSLVKPGSGIGGGIGAMGEGRAHVIFLLCSGGECKRRAGAHRKQRRKEGLRAAPHPRWRHHRRLPRSRGQSDRVGAGAARDVI